MALVNVTLAGDTVPSAVFDDSTSMVTSAVGSVLRTIVKVAVVPSSRVLPLIADTVIPATSSSVQVT